MFCLADDPAKSSAANDSDTVITEAITESESNSVVQLPVKSVGSDSKVMSLQSDIMMSDNNACESTDDGEDRVLFNADILCSEHGKMHCIRHSQLSYQSL